MDKLLKSRKAVGFDDFLPLVIAVFIFLMVFLFVGFAINNSEKAKINSVEEIKDKIMMTDALINYLRADVQDYNLKIADLIYLAEDDKKYLPLLISTTEQYFSSLPENYFSKYSYELSIAGKNIGKSIPIGNRHCPAAHNILQSEVLLPSHAKDYFIKVSINRAYC
jgi:hypothetical protein